MEKTQKISNRNGFTLLEVMIAFVILAIGLLGLAALQIVAVKGNAFSSEMTFASMLAQQKLEELKNIDFDNLTNGSDVFGDESIEREKSKGVIYQLNWQISDGPLNDMKTITLEIKWESLRLGKANQSTQEREVKANFTAFVSR
ncbi:MAG: hypothetical protein DRG83_03640 [Deltaproteobacteria bacterium]|nr:MAG: hypothetical protein DRG83_03640 [Deltaproteobacteria bacterium]